MYTLYSSLTGRVCGHCVMQGAWQHTESSCTMVAELFLTKNSRQGALVLRPLTAGSGTAPKHIDFSACNCAARPPPSVCLSVCVSLHTVRGVSPPTDSGVLTQLNSARLCLVGGGGGACRKHGSSLVDGRPGGLCHWFVKGPSCTVDIIFQKVVEIQKLRYYCIV